MSSVKDKTVLIVGRGSGIARAIARAVSNDGGRVAPIPVDGGEHLV
jgi:NAD(P)-dependent dehydrogenase (short-subunit alcohol dehydrogenase family)